ncbi:MAG: hypothetical protein K5663_11315 [Clostridiales bacterium]|nr:hypothetical protein [Clostridiales bacterium]
MTISYEEYAQRVREHIQKGYPSWDKEYVENLFKKGCVRADYEEGLLEAKILNRPFMGNPSGFCYGCHMFYPDYPDTYEEYKAKEKQQKNLFDMNFEKVREG